MGLYHMTLEEVKKYYGRAKAAACAHCRPELSDDFAQEMFVCFLEHPDRHATIDQLFIDYLRKHFGRRNIDGKPSYKFKGIQNTVSLSEVVPGSSGFRYGDLIADTREPFKSWDVFELCKRLLSKREWKFIEETYVNGETQKKAGELLGWDVTESRYSQFHQKIIKKLRKAGDMKDYMKDEGKGIKLITRKCRTLGCTSEFRCLPTSTVMHCSHACYLNSIKDKSIYISELKRLTNPAGKKSRPAQERKEIMESGKVNLKTKDGMTASEIAEALGKSPSNISYSVHSGKLIPSGRNEKGKPLYSLEDARSCITHRKKKSAKPNAQLIGDSYARKLDSPILSGFNKITLEEFDDMVQTIREFLSLPQKEWKLLLLLKDHLKNAG